MEVLTRLWEIGRRKRAEDMQKYSMYYINVQKRIEMDIQSVWYTLEYLISQAKCCFFSCVRQRM